MALGVRKWVRRHHIRDPNLKRLLETMIRKGRNLKVRKEKVVDY